MNIAIDTDYLNQILNVLLTTPSPTGFTDAIMEKVEQLVQQLGFKMEYNHKGCGIVTIPSEERRGSLLYSAHVDTLGAMVRSIKENGAIRFTPIGGYTMHSIENEYCVIHTRDGKSYTGTILANKPSVHASKLSGELDRTEEHMEIRIDEPVNSKADVLQLGITAGDFISFEPRNVMLDNGYIKSRHLDDKAGVAALLALLEWIGRENRTPRKTLKLFFSVYEEVGHGSAHIPEDTDEMIAVDMGVVGEDLNGTEMDVMICAKDSSGPYDYKMVSQLVKLSQEHQLSYAIDIYPHYGSDASAALRAGGNIRAALIGPGVHASHAMERTHIQAIRSTAILLAAYAFQST